MTPAWGCLGWAHANFTSVLLLARIGEDAGIAWVIAPMSAICACWQYVRARRLMGVL